MVEWTDDLQGQRQEQLEASAEDASKQGVVADLAEAPREQWLEGEEDRASTEAVHGSAEEGERRDESRNAVGGVSGAAVRHSQREGEQQQRDYQWDDEVRHWMPGYEQSTWGVLLLAHELQEDICMDRAGCTSCSWNLYSDPSFLSHLAGIGDWPGLVSSNFRIP